MDDADARLLLALTDDPRATIVALAERAGLARNTVHARLARFDRDGTLAEFERRIDPDALGYPLTAFVSAVVVQQKLDHTARALAEIPEVIETFGLSGSTDLLIRVAARDAEDLYRIASAILDTPGIERTETALVMRTMIEYRVRPLLTRESSQPQSGRQRPSRSASRRP